MPMSLEHDPYINANGFSEHVNQNQYGLIWIINYEQIYENLSSLTDQSSQPFQPFSHPHLK